MPTIPPNPFILVDGSSYLYRAFHALPPLTNSSGQPTGAMYGVINMLRKLMNDYSPTHIAVVFDDKGKTFRDDLYPEYKAHRPPMPDDLKSQVEPLHAIIKSMGLPLLMIAGVEADDVIGTLAKAAALNDRYTLISTADKDFAQLVNSHIVLINTMSGTVLDREGVIDKFGLPPERIIDYLALVGDTSDNVPGVPGVGPKTAVKWLLEYGSLAGVIENADKITGKVGENLRANLEILSLCQQLVTIKTDVELPMFPDDLTLKPRDSTALIDDFKRLEFKSWLEELLRAKTGEVPAVVATKNYHAVLTEADFATWLKKLTEATLFAFDTETTSLNYMDAELVGLSFSINENEAIYIPVGHDYDGAPTQLSRAWVLAQLRPLLESPTHAKVGHNIKYDMSVLANYGIKVQGIAFDTMLEAFVLGSGNRHDLDTLTLKYLGHRNISFEEVAGKGAKQLTFNQVSVEVATPYAAEDADMAMQLHRKLWPQLEKIPELATVLTTIEMPLVPVLSRLERNGVLIDSAKLIQQSGELSQRLTILEKMAFDFAGESFNLGSPKQLQQILYERLGLPILKKTPTGQPSTGEDVLVELAHDYELPSIILEYRGLSKLKSTYTDTLPLQINKTTGRVHTSYHQVGAITGRFSSSDPNLQNIPARTEEGRRIRQAFIATPGYKIVAADYSQIELRIMAHLSQDPGLLSAFSNDIDIHKATAAEVFGVPLAEVTSMQRRSAKVINFGLIYGMSAFGLAKQLDVDRQAAQEYMNIYFARYPGVKHYMENSRKIAHEQGYVKTIFGRRLYLPEINSKNMMMQKAAERAAINAPMQGTAADIIKKAMVHVDDYFSDKNGLGRMIMQVHDELVFEIKESETAVIAPVIQQLMAEVVKLDVPLVANVGIGNNWDEAH